MNTAFRSVSLASLLVAGVGLCSLGCDVAEPDAPTDRSAVLVLEVDGEAVERSDISRSPGVQADVLELAASSPSAVCEGDAATLDLVLELDGEHAGTVQGCMDATEVNASAADAFVADADVQASPWCLVCDNTYDCFACCRCDGNLISQCAQWCN
ncbi:MAG: hypothetical protein K0V04_01885 [Deltaproteobacteria bacterium]|nr:hypothetical protein [Deltaproteobacteria bacterium]